MKSNETSFVGKLSAFPSHTEDETCQQTVCGDGHDSCPQCLLVDVHRTLYSVSIVGTCVCWGRMLWGALSSHWGNNGNKVDREDKWLALGTGGIPRLLVMSGSNTLEMLIFDDISWSVRTQQHAERPSKIVSTICMLDFQPDPKLLTIKLYYWVRMNNRP